MRVIEARIGKGQPFEYVARNEGVIRPARSRHGGTRINRWRNDIETNDVRVWEHEGDLLWPSPRSTADVNNVTRVHQRREVVPLERIPQDIVLEVEPANLLVVFWQIVRQPREMPTIPKEPETAVYWIRIRHAWRVRAF